MKETKQFHFLLYSLQSSNEHCLIIARQPTVLLLPTSMSMSYPEWPPTMFNEGTEVPVEPGLLGNSLHLI